MTKLRLPIGIGARIDGGPFNDAEVSRVSKEDGMITFAAPRPWDPETEESSISVEELADRIEDEIASDEPISVSTTGTDGRKRPVFVEVEPHEYASILFADDLFYTEPWTDEAVEWLNEKLTEVTATYGNL